MVKGHMCIISTPFNVLRFAARSQKQPAMGNVPTRTSSIVVSAELPWRIHGHLSFPIFLSGAFLHYMQVTMVSIPADSLVFISFV